MIQEIRSCLKNLLTEEILPHCHCYPVIPMLPLFGPVYQISRMPEFLLNIGLLETNYACLSFQPCF
jgi:hypothetical protein